MKFLIIVLLFFAISALLIISNNDLALYERENFDRFSELYAGWLNNIYTNVQTLTGNIVKLGWLPG